MSVYSVKKKGWRYDFTLEGKRYSQAWFKTKAEAKDAEAERRREIKEIGLQPAQVAETPTDMVFLELVNRRLDHVKAYRSERHYREHLYIAKRWLKCWNSLTCSQLTRDMVESFVKERVKVSPYTGNKEIRYLRALFNFGVKKGLIEKNPTTTIDFFPVEKRLKYVPSIEDIDKVIGLADLDTKDYLWTIRETMARVSEVNGMTWEDVNLEARYVVLYTRKKKGGNRTPRKVPMTGQLHEILSRRFSERDPKISWVFWHSYVNRATREKVTGPFGDRKRFMTTLCKKAGVKYFRFHALRHAGASLMERSNVPVGSIQRILGHEHRSTTEIYLHSIGNAEREAMKAYECARQGVSHTVSHS